MMIKTLKTGFSVLLLFLLTLPFIIKVNAENFSQNILMNNSNSWGEKTAELLMADGSEDFSPIEYSLEIIARAGQAVTGPSTIANLGWGPSINDSGFVAFTASIEDGREAVFIGDGDFFEERSLLANSFYYSLGSRVLDVNLHYLFGDVVQINNENEVVWGAKPRDGLIGFIIRQGSMNSDFKLVAKTHYPIRDSISPFQDPVIPGDAFFPWVTLSNKTDNSSRVVFSAIPRSGPLHTILATPVDTETGGHTEETDYHFSGFLLDYPNIYPMISDNILTVVKAGDDPDDELIVFTDETLIPGQFVAAPPEFSAVGYRSGISDDGRLISFMGDHSTNGVGIYAKPGPNILIKIAGISGDGKLDPGEEWDDINSNGQVDPGEDDGPFKLSQNIAPFWLSNRVGVNRTSPETDTQYTIVYLANVAMDVHGNPIPQGLYTSRVDISDPVDPKISDPTLVVKVGDYIAYLPGAVTKIDLYDPVNNNGQIALWVETPDAQAIIRATEDICTSRVFWASGQPIKGAVIEAYYFRDYNGEIEPIHVESGQETITSEDGSFCIPRELTEAPPQLWEKQPRKLRGIRAKITYTEYTNGTILNPEGIERVIVNYPDWDPMRPEKKPTTGRLNIVFPNPVFFQAGVQGRISDDSADGQLSGFLTLNSGATALEIGNMFPVYYPEKTPTVDQLTQWVAVKQGDEFNPPIPAFLYFGMPSGPKLIRHTTCNWFLPTDDVEWGYNNCAFQSENYVNYSGDRINYHFEARIKPQIESLSPGENVPFHIMAHSLGGIITRNWLSRLNSQTSIDKYVTFDSPHGAVLPSNLWPWQFWSEAAMNGVASLLNPKPKLADQGWNYGRILPASRKHLLLASPDNPVITPPDRWFNLASNYSAFGIGRIMLKIFPWDTTGYCERFIGGWELPVANAGHGLQNTPRSMIAAVRFLTSDIVPSLGDDDTGLGQSTITATFGAGEGDQCPNIPLGPSQVAAAEVTPNPSKVKKRLYTLANTQTDEPLYFDSNETLTVSAFVSHNDANVMVLNSSGIEIPRSNEVVTPFGENSYFISYDLDVSIGTGTLRLTAGVEDTDAYLTVQYGNNLHALVGTSDLHYAKGSQATIHIQLLDANDVLVVGTVGVGSVMVTEPNGTQSILSVFDDGLNGDGAAGDGVYGTFFTDTIQPGRYYISGDLTVNLGGNINARRTAEGMFFVDSNAAALIAVTDERLIDDNSNGQWDAFEVDIDVDVIENGEFALSAKVLDNGKVVENLREVFEATTAPIVQTVTLRIPATLFQKIGTGNPLTFGSIELIENVQVLYLDSLPDYTTQTFQLSDFDPPLPPNIFFALPSFDLHEGGKKILINGRGFENVTEVYFGIQQVQDFTVHGDSTIEVTVPAWDGVNEKVTIRLVTPWNETSTAGIFEYYSPHCKGDIDLDGDIDGSDLIAYIADLPIISLAEFAGDFGRKDCPQ